MMEDWELPRARVRVRASGDADAARRVLFAVDPPNTLEMYGPLFARLKPHARIAAFEPPGFGFSRTRRGYRHSLDHEADVVAALLERLGASPQAPWVLAFPCIAAYAAVRLAQRRPDLVAGLVLLQAPSWSQEAAWVDGVDRRGLLRIPGMGQALTFLRADAIIRSWYRASMPDEAQAQRHAKLAIESMDHGARFPLATAFQALFPRGRIVSGPGVAPDGVPTLVVWGGADRSHRRSDPASMREHAPGAELLVLENVGHFPELEDPRGFTDALLGWLQKNGL